jgi:hypothetical protein
MAKKTIVPRIISKSFIAAPQQIMDSSMIRLLQACSSQSRELQARF